MRNEPKPLNDTEKWVYDAVFPKLVAALTLDRPVEVTYNTRDGRVGSARGKIQFVNGTPNTDTHSVTIDTREDKGRPTTVNICRMRTFKRV